MLSLLNVLISLTGCTAGAAVAKIVIYRGDERLDFEMATGQTGVSSGER
jgi:hypothetical protein